MVSRTDYMYMYCTVRSEVLAWYTTQFS